MAAIDPSIFEYINVTSTDGKNTINIAGGVVSLSFFENLFSPHISAKFLVVNTGGVVDGKSVYQGLPLRGGERVDMKIVNDSCPDLELTQKTQNELYVASITNVLVEAEREVFTLNCVSREALANETARVGKRYGSKISESVKQIVKDYLGSDKKIEVDPTMNDYKFIGNMKKPFSTLIWLASKSVPGGDSSGEKEVKNKSSTAGYFFYESRKGFHFKSVDALCTQDPVGDAYTFQPGIVDQDDPNKDFRIISHSTNKNHNLMANLEKGMFSTHRVFYDPRNGTFTPQQQGTFTITESSKNMNNLGEKYKTSLPKDKKTGKNLADIPSRLITGVLDIGTLEKEEKNSAVKNADPMEIFSQSMMRYNMMFIIETVVTIPLNTNLIAGNLINCNFVAITEEKKKEIDETTSGLYMIKELVHYYESKGSYTKLKLIRDTHGKRDK